MFVQLRSRKVDAHVNTGLKFDAFRSQLFKSPVDNPLFEFEIGNAVAQETTDTVVLLDHRNEVARAVQLLSGREARRTRSDDGDVLCRPLAGWFGNDEALLPGALGNRFFDSLDRHRGNC